MGSNAWMPMPAKVVQETLGHSTITLAIDGSNRAIALWNQETSSTEFAADLHTLLTED